MRKMLAILVCLMLVVGTLVACAPAAPASGGTTKIFLITMDQMDQYWAGIDKGCQKAVAELGNIDYKWTAPDVKDDAKQIEMINNAVANGANAILLAANGPDAVTSALKEATDKGVKIIYVDSPANFAAEATFATDNEAAGRTAGEEMLKNFATLGVNSGDIGIISVNAATASTVAREKGFRAALDGKGFNLLETQFCDGDAAKSKDAATNFITQGVVGIFGANEGSAVGAGNAIKEAGKSVVGIGFDSSDAIMSLLGDGSLKATMVQNPDVMGYEGVKAAMTALAGGTIAQKVVDTGVSVVTSTAPAAPPASSETFKIFLITMDQMDQYWAGIDKGCQKAIAELGNVDYKWTAPDVKDDAKQIEMINNAVANGANAILLAANGPDAVTSALKEAESKGVKIVYVDSPANYASVATFSTNNEAAGATAGEEMLKNLAAQGVSSGNIGIISVNTATASTVAREKGFRSALEGKGFTILETQYCDGDAAKSKDAATNFITQGVVGMFGANEGSAVGAGNAIKESGKNIIGIGFDSSDAIMSLLSSGALKATMVQNPEVMGYEGVKAAVTALTGGTIPQTAVDTGVSVVTK